MSAALGRPFMPWQARAADVAFELDPVTGRFAYPLVIVTVPRQAGKTALVLATSLHRGLAQDAARVWYTAQTGIKAREQFTEMIETVERSPFRSLASCKRGAGDTRIDLPVRGSRLKAHPPTGDSLHGNQSDLNIVDEGWFFDEPSAHALMGAITPTQLTRSNPQTIIVSTEGTALSTWFHGLVDDARAGMPGVCLIDYGIGPEVDPEDIEAIAAAHPAVGHTCTVDSIREARAGLSAGEFARAYGNRRTGSRDRIIPASFVEAATTERPLPDGPVAFGAAVSVDRSSTAIVAGAFLDGVPIFEVIEVRPGSSWAPARLAELVDGHRNTGLAIDRLGPSGALADAVEQKGVELVKVTTQDVTTRATDVYDRIMHTPPRLFMRPDPSLDAAFDVITTRKIGESWTWSRAGSGGSIAPVEAMTMCAHALLNAPAAPAAPLIWSPA